MKTNVVMKSEKDRNLLGVVIRQETKTGFLNLSDLSEAYTQARVRNGWPEKNIGRIMNNLSFRSWFEKEFNILTGDDFGAKFLKEKGLQITSGARHTKTVWIDPRIYDYVYDRLFNERQSAPSFSFSNRYIQLLKIVFSGVLPFTAEYKVLNYRVDVYFESLNLCIEFDEPYHSKKKQAGLDIIRQDLITKELQCKFLRFKIGQELESIRQILLIYKSENILSVAQALGV